MQNKRPCKAIYNFMHGGARVGGCDCDEQAHKGEVAHDIAVLAQKRAVADAVAPGSRSTARRPFLAVLGSLGWWPALDAWPMCPDPLVRPMVQSCPHPRVWTAHWINYPNYFQSKHN